jgi:hypothetical protein
MDHAIKLAKLVIAYQKCLIAMEILNALVVNLVTIWIIISAKVAIRSSNKIHQRLVMMDV